MLPSFAVGALPEERAAERIAFFIFICYNNFAETGWEEWR